MSAQSLSALGQIQATTRSLELDIMGAIVSIRHEDRQDIAINANYPDTWTIKGGSVRQTRYSVPFGNSNIVIGGSVYYQRRCHQHRSRHYYGSRRWPECVHHQR